MHKFEVTNTFTSKVININVAKREQMCYQINNNWDMVHIIDLNMLST